MPVRVPGWGSRGDLVEPVPSVEWTAPARPATLQLAICQKVHHVEWHDQSGRRRSGHRDNACADCLRLADVFADHLTEVLRSAEGYAALQGGPLAVVELVMGRES